MALSYELANALSFAHLKSCGFCRPVYGDEAFSRISQLAEVLALDAFLGVDDRPSDDGNHIFSVSALSWQSVDYASCLRPAFDQPYPITNSPSSVEPSNPIMLDLRTESFFR